MKKLLSMVLVLSLFVFSSVFAYAPTTKDGNLIETLEQKVETLKKTNPTKLEKIEKKLSVVLKRLDQNTQIYYILASLHQMINPDTAGELEQKKLNEIKKKKEEAKKKAEIKAENERKINEEKQEIEEKKRKAEEERKRIEEERKKLEEEKNQVETTSNGTRIYRNSVCDHTYYRGPRGGCYYINGNNNKSYDGTKRCCRNR